MLFDKIVDEFSNDLDLFAKLFCIEVKMNAGINHMNSH